MIATSHFHQAHAFLPVVPSPLSARSANIYGPRRHPDRPAFGSTMASTSSTDENAPIFKRVAESANTTTPRVPFAQRKVKTAPVPRAETLRAQRRDAYLRRVQVGREDRRFEARGDDMMRLDFVRRQRAWEAEQARAARNFGGEDDEFGEGDGEEDMFDAAELPGHGGSQMQLSSQASELPPLMMSEEEVEEFLRVEDRELAALLEYMPDEEQDSDGLWSDDVDYDELFSHVLDQQSDAPLSTQGMDVPMDDGEEMDVT